MPPTAAAKPARRSLWVFSLIALGFLLTREAGHTLSSPQLFSIACAFTAAGCFSRGLACRILLALAVLSASAGWYTLRILEHPRHALAACLNTDPLAEPDILTLEGAILDRPRLREPDRGEFDSPIGETNWLIEFDADALQTEKGPVPVQGRVRLYLADDPRAPAAPDSLRPGDRIRITGAVEPVRPRNNPGEFDLAAWAAQEHLAGTMSAPGAQTITPAEPPTGLDSLRAHWLRWRSWLRDRADAALRFENKPSGADHSQTRALMRSLLLGERDPELRDVQVAFQNLGLVHLVAISGFNLAVMAFIALFLLRATGDRGWLEPALLALVVILYMLVLPAQTPIIRSGLLVLALLLSEAGGRRYDRLTTLGWIGCALLLYKPLDLWSLGFQLSMGVTAALLWQGHRVTDRLFRPELRGLVPNRSRTWDARLRRALGALWRTLKHTAAVSLLAWCVAAPTVLVHTGMLSPLAPLTTILVLPLVTIVLWAGYLALVLGMFLPAITSFTGTILDLLASFLINAVLLLDALPGTTLHLPRVSPLWALAATLCILFWFARGHTRHARAWTASALFLLWLALELALGPRLAAGTFTRSTAIRIDTLNVGDGTCHLIRSGGGPDDAILWDCGSLTPRIADRTVTRAIRALGAGKVRTAVITHANTDHYSGLADVAGPLGLRVVLISHHFADLAARDSSSAPARLLAALRDKDITIRAVAAGDTLDLAHARLTFLWPPSDYTPRLINDASLVARIEPAHDSYGPALLLTGDIGPESIARLLARDDTADLTNIAVLELPHHGSVNEPAIDLVRQLAPRVILQSTGPRRGRRTELGEWSHLRADHPAWHITARSGAAWAEISSDGAIGSGTHP